VILSNPVLKEVAEDSIRVPRMFKSHLRPTVRYTIHNVMIIAISEYISYKITPGSEKDYRASSITAFILSAA
jgi:hypothetical protein